VSTGELFREALRDGTPLGDQVRAYVEKGRLVPDEVTIEVVTRRLSRDDAAAGAILDGFPRTRAQAEALDDILAGTGDRVVAALYVEVPSDALVGRLSGRLTCSDDDQHVYHVTARPPRHPGVCDLCGAPLVRRKDDEPETIRTRLDRQLPPMYEVIDHYAEAGVLFAVPGDQPAEQVTQDLLHSLAGATRS
jgi:adenylate kinase